MSHVAETSIEAFYSLGVEYLQPKEQAVMRVFGPGTKLSRQQISEVARIPLHTVCGRVDSLISKGKLVEEGERRDPMTGKRQKLLWVPFGQKELF